MSSTPRHGGLALRGRLDVGIDFTTGFTHGYSWFDPFMIIYCISTSHFLLNIKTTKWSNHE
jgi:hypothetical protein